MLLLFVSSSSCIQAWSDALYETPRLQWGPPRSCHDRLHLVLSATSMSRKRHESVMSSVMNGKGLYLSLRLHGCHRKLVREAHAYA